MLAPSRPPSPPDDLELLIREARARQRRRRLLFAGGVAVVAAAGLSVWAALPGRGGAERGGIGGGAPAAGRGLDVGRVPISEVGTSGGVTWALNGLGMWLTTNSGRTWRRSLPRHVAAMGDAISRVQQVQFLDPRHGWLLAVDVRGGLRPAWRRHAELDWTSDGGRTWHWSIPNGCCGPFSFVNRHLGFFSSNDGFYETRNAGATWKLVKGRNYGDSVPTFVDARHGTALVDGGLLRTGDGGRHWKEVLLSGQPPAAGNDIVVSGPIATVGHRLVLIAERHFAETASGDWRTVPYVSGDRGASWTARPFPVWWVPYVGNNDGNRFSAASATVWFAAARQEFAVTTDAGRTWRRVQTADVPARWMIGAIDFTSARAGWAIFNGPGQSVLMRTRDGGLHWTAAGPRARKQHAR